MRSFRQLGFAALCTILCAIPVWESLKKAKAGSSVSVQLGAPTEKRLAVHEIYPMAVRRLEPWKQFAWKRSDFCSPGATPPMEVVTRYISCVVNGEMETVYHYAGSDLTERLRGQSEQERQFEKKIISDWFGQDYLWITHVLRLGDNLIVVVSGVPKGDEGVKMPLFLKRAQGRWKMTEPSNEDMHSALQEAFPFKKNIVWYQSSSGGTRTRRP